MAGRQNADGSPGTKITQLSELCDCEKEDFESTILNNKDVVFNYALNDVTQILEEREFDTLLHLQQNLCNLVCECDTFAELRDLHPMKRRVKHTAIQDIYYLGHSLIKGNLLDEARSIFGKKKASVNSAEDDAANTSTAGASVSISIIEDDGGDIGHNVNGDSEHLSQKVSMLVSTVSNMKLMLSNFMKEVSDDFKKSTDIMQISLDKAHEVIFKQEMECDVLQKEVRNLNDKVRKLESEASHRVPASSLLVGDRLLRDIDEKKLLKTKVKCISGAKITDVAKYLSEENDTSMGKIYLCVGTNDCIDPNLEIASAVDSYRKMVSDAQEIVPNPADIVISSIPPRGDKHQEQVLAVNAALCTVAEDTGATYVNNDVNFILPDGSINDGFLLPADPVHLSRQGTNRIIKNLKMAVKSKHLQDITKTHVKKGHQVVPNAEMSSLETDAVRGGDGFGQSLWAASHKKARASKYAKKLNYNMTRSPPRSYDDRNAIIDTTNQNVIRDATYRTHNQVSSRCDFCGEHSHTKLTCGFKKPAFCRQCAQPGHKQKFCVEFSRH